MQWQSQYVTTNLTAQASIYSTSVAIYSTSVTYQRRKLSVICLQSRPTGTGHCHNNTVCFHDSIMKVIARLLPTRSHVKNQQGQSQNTHLIRNLHHVHIIQSLCRHSHTVYKAANCHRAVTTQKHDMLHLKDALLNRAQKLTVRIILSF